MSFAVVGFPELDNDDYRWIQKIRSVYDLENQNLIEPHFTFVFPTTVVDLHPLKTHVHKRILNQVAIAFKLNRIEIIKSFTENIWNLFLVPGTGYENMINLHDRLYTGILTDELRADIPYIPHITVGTFSDIVAGQDVAGKVKGEGVEIDGLINEVAVIEIADGSIKILENIKLGEASV